MERYVIIGVDTHLSCGVYIRVNEDTDTISKVDDVTYASVFSDKHKFELNYYLNRCKREMPSLEFVKKDVTSLCKARPVGKLYDGKFSLNHELDDAIFK